MAETRTGLGTPDKGRDNLKPTYKSTVHNRRADALLATVLGIAVKRDGMFSAVDRQGLEVGVVPDHETVALDIVMHQLGEGEIMRGYDLPSGWVRDRREAMGKGIETLIGQEFMVDVEDPAQVATLPQVVKKTLREANDGKRDVLATDQFKGPLGFDGTRERVEAEFEVPGLVALQTRFNNEQESRMSDAEAKGAKSVRRQRRRGHALDPHVQAEITEILEADKL